MKKLYIVLLIGLLFLLVGCFGEGSFEPYINYVETVDYPPISIYELDEYDLYELDEYKLYELDEYDLYELDEYKLYEPYEVDDYL